MNKKVIIIGMVVVVVFVIVIVVFIVVLIGKKSIRDELSFI